MPEPLALAIPRPSAATAMEVAAALARAAPPPLAARGDAPWLRPEQRATARCLVGVLERHGGALLADPVGSGKTFVALAVADALRGAAPAAAIVPAPLIHQWRARAEGCGVPLEVLSHVAVSRGMVPSEATRVVVIDESHHFRHHSTCRYEVLAPFLVGRRVLCVTATPAVNRLEDLAHQLLLGVRDDALRASGTPSLRQALRAGAPPAALGELVIATPPSADLPALSGRATRWNGVSDPAEPAWLSELDALALSSQGPIAALVRCVLLGAAASSPAALRASLARYALLLRHGEDARRAGRPVDRAMIRRFTAEAPEQLLLWEMLPGEVGALQLPLADLDRVDRLRASIDLQAVDSKVETLRSLIADGEPTLVFANAVATIPYLRDRLLDSTPAWITGARAGWRHVPVPRERVLEWFRPGAPDVSPRVLLASDVAAEGLDLQRAKRVVHYDLPWTAMRLAQREGRSRRLGGMHAEVEVVRMEPPGWIERRIRISAVLHRKSLLAARAGLDGDSSSWRWRHELGAAWSGVTAREGMTAVEGERSEALIGLEVATAHALFGVTTFAVVDLEGRWTEAPSEVCGRIALLRDASARPVTDEEWEAWRTRIAPLARAVLQRATASAWAAGPHTPEGRALVKRLQQLARKAAREREVDRLRRLEGSLAFARRGHTAGEERKVDAMLRLDDDALARERDDPREAGAVGGIRTVRIVGAVVFVAGRARRRR